MSAELTLRPYQQECVDTIDSLPDGAKSIVALATGLGKTVVMSRIHREGRMLILSHRDELVRQPEKYFDCSFGIEKADEQAQETDEIVSASVQSLARDTRLQRYSPDAFDIIIVDECHHAAAPGTYGKILSYFHPRKLIGLTATPTRGDGVSLANVFDSICFARDLAWGIENGYLTQIKGMLIRESDVDLTGVHMVAGDYNVSELSGLLEDSNYYVTTAETYIHNGSHDANHTLVYCINVAACQIVASLIKERLPEEKRSEVEIITGTTTPDERHRIEADFMSGKVRCIVNCLVLTEGSDLPITDRIIVCRPTANPTLYTQIVGRGTRLAEGKSSCLVLDILPQTTKRICSITSMVDENINLLPKRLVKQWESEPVSLEDIRNAVKEIREQRLGVIHTLSEEYDIFEKEVERDTACVEQAVKSENFGQTLLDAVYRTELDIDTSVLPGIHYAVGPTSGMRYQITGNKEETIKAWISEPDVLSNVSVIASVNGKWYRTDKPVSVKMAADCIRKILERECSDSSSLLLWDEALITSWKNSPATVYQIQFIEKCLKAEGYEVVPQAEPLSKYAASISIDYLKKCNSRKKRLKEIEADLKKLQKGRKFDELPSEPIKYKPFADLYKQYKNVTIVDREKLHEKKPANDFTQTIEIEPNRYIRTGTNPPASEAQKQFLYSICSSVAQYSDISSFRSPWLHSFNRGASVSALLDTFKALKADPRFVPSEHPFIYLLDHTDSYQHINPQIRTTFTIRVVYHLSDADIQEIQEISTEKWNASYTANRQSSLPNSPQKEDKTPVHDVKFGEPVKIPKKIAVFKTNPETINANCAKQIESLNACTHVSFKQFKSLQTGGLDGWSVLKMEDATKKFKASVIKIVREQFTNERDIICCLRWYGRGLNLQHCIDKIKVDTILAANATASQKRTN